MLPDVAQPRGAEQRVAHGVDQHIGVGMPSESFLVRNFHAADDEPAPGHQRVSIKPLSNPHQISHQDAKDAKNFQLK
jgi:hypothetical protein